jgi:hypothetical protein
MVIEAAVSQTLYTLYFRRPLIILVYTLRNKVKKFSKSQTGSDVSVQLASLLVIRNRLVFVLRGFSLPTLNYN